MADITLTADVAYNDPVLHVTEPSPYAMPFLATIEGETVAVVSGASTLIWETLRGASITGRSAHAAGAVVSPISGSGGSGSLLLTGAQGGSVASVTEVQTPGTVKQVSAGVAAVGGSVIVSDTDPGAIGPGNLWLFVAFADGNGDGGYGQLWVRNSTDNGWNPAGPMTYSDGGQTLVTSPADVGELALNDAGGSSLTDPTSVGFIGGGKSLVVGAAGISVGADGAPLLLSGTINPAAGGGVAAVPGSLYLRNGSGPVGEVYKKVGAADTAWVPVFNNTSLGAYFAAGPIALQSAVDADIAIATQGTGVLTLSAGGGVRLLNLPTADPAIANQLYTDGVPSAGVPKPLMVSGG